MRDFSGTKSQKLSSIIVNFPSSKILSACQILPSGLLGLIKTLAEILFLEVFQPFR